MAPLLGEPQTQLACGGGLARALKPEQQDHPRPLTRRLKAAFGVAEEGHHLVADDLDDLLRRRQAAQDLLVHGAIADAVDERLDDLEIDVGFEQGETNLAKRGLDRLRCQPELAAKRFENVLQACAEGVEHDRYPGLASISIRRAFSFPIAFRSETDTACVAPTSASSSA